MVMVLRVETPATLTHGRVSDWVTRNCRTVFVHAERYSLAHPAVNRPAVQRRRESAIERVRAVIEQTGVPGVVLTRPGPVAWATGGINPPIDRGAPIDTVWIAISMSTLHGDHHRGRGPAHRRRAAAGRDGVGGGAMVGRRRVRGRRR